MTMRKRGLIAFVLMLCAVTVLAAPEIPHLAEEFRVKCDAVFEFAREPAVTRDGDNVTISFATKGFCDVTVAIEDAS